MIRFKQQQMSMPGNAESGSMTVTGKVLAAVLKWLLFTHP
jgi:hypothetical protein